MKFILSSIFILFVFFLNTQCKKNKSTLVESTEEPAQAIVYDNYLAIKKSNYWIYENFIIDESGNINKNGIDSCYYSRDTIIRNKTFHVIIKQNLSANYSLLSDSLDCIIDATIGMIFSSSNFSTILRTDYGFEYSDPTNTSSPKDTIYKGQLKMSGKDSLVSIPAGNFKTINAKTIYSVYPKFVTTGGAKTKYSNRLYCKNVGLVYEDYPLISNSYVVGRKLIRYRIN